MLFEEMDVIMGTPEHFENENRRLKQLVADLKEEIERQQEDLEKVDRLKGEFVDMAAHDLRTPVTVIKESLAQLQDRLFGDLNPGQEHLLELALLNTERLADCINQYISSAKER